MAEFFREMDPVQVILIFTVIFGAGGMFLLGILRTMRETRKK